MPGSALNRLTQDYWKEIENRSAAGKTSLRKNLRNHFQTALLTLFNSKDLLAMQEIHPEKR